MPPKKKGRIQGVGLVLSLPKYLRGNILPDKPTDPNKMIHHDMINWRPKVKNNKDGK